MYCSVQDVKDEYNQDVLVQLTDDTNTGLINDSVIEKQITRANNIIDLYVSGKYETPLETKSIITQIAVELTLYFLHERGNSVTETTENIYKRNIKLLEEVKKNLITLKEQRKKGEGFGKVITRPKVYTDEFFGGMT